MSGTIHRLDGTRSSLVIDTGGAGIPLLRYWGQRLPDGFDAETLAGWYSRPLPDASLDRDVPLTLLPEFGFGWFGTPGLLGCRDRRDWATAFELIGQGRNGNGITLHCRDTVAGLELDLAIELDVDTDVISRRSVLRNTGDRDYWLSWCAAGVFPLPGHCREALSFQGKWAQEFQERRILLGVGIWSRENRRGPTSHDAFPGVIVGTAGFSEQRGEVYGFHLGWSGNHRLLSESLDDGRRQLQMGAWLTPGEIVLAPGEHYASPTVYAAYSAQGLNPLSDGFHRFVRRRILHWPGRRMTPRPVHFNTWEALYFDHDFNRLRALADAAAALGVERYVLDDGWFRGRDHTRAGLGDWTPDPRKYPDGLGPLVDYVRGLGMEFGLWLEPEMVNPDSDLYRAHPDWALHLAGRPTITGRNQLVLDLTRREVGDYLFEAIGRLLCDHPVTYLKWDMNRAWVTAGSAGIAAYHRQTRALYALIDRLRTAHPGVEIETCASGGGRADYGILIRTQRVWTSDSNDALERQSIQRGFGRFFPPEIMGAHIGPSPAHTSGRRHTLAFRAATALFGHLGLELDLLELSAGERTELQTWIALYKRLRHLLHGGRTLRLDDLEPGKTGHGVVATDSTEALFSVVQLSALATAVPAPIRLPGLDPSTGYRLTLLGPPAAGLRFDTAGLQALRDGTLILSGAALAGVGLQLPVQPPESALLLHLQRCPDDTVR